MPELTIQKELGDSGETKKTTTKKQKNTRSENLERTRVGDIEKHRPVSYTHLTLPTRRTV